jgi:RND family efflux transporter MFP subunit
MSSRNEPDRRSDEGRPQAEHPDASLEHREEQSRLGQTGSRWRRVILILAASITAVIAVVIVAYFVLRSPQPAATTTTDTVVSVSVAKAERQPIAAETSAIGTVFPREQATVAAKVSAQIRSMRILKNQVVKAGEVIALLESRDLVAQRNEAVAALNQERASERSVTTGTIPQTNAQDQKALRDAQARVRTASATYERRLVLYQKGGISKKDLETSQMDLTTSENELRLAEQTVVLRTKAINPNDRALAAARVQAAQQRVATLDAQLSYATIRAPITGVVTDQFQYQGEFAAAGGKLVNIADLSEVIVKAQFADTIVAQAKVGDPATVQPTDQAGERMTGKVSLISRSSDPLNRTVEVWVNLGNGAGRLLAGGAAQVSVATNQTGDAIVVPATAVTLDATNSDTGTVMVVDASNVAHETKVTVGIRTPQTVQITSGLQGGETVVVIGNYALPDGAKVEVTK